MPNFVLKLGSGVHPTPVPFETARQFAEHCQPFYTLG